MQAGRYYRKRNRIPLSLPVTIRFRDADDDEQLCRGEVVDASKCGLRIKVDRYFKREATVFLTLHFPERLRAHERGSENYPVDAVVVHTKKYGPDDFEIGVKFLPDKMPGNASPLNTAKIPLSKRRLAK